MASTAQISNDINSPLKSIYSACSNKAFNLLQHPRSGNEDTEVYLLSISVCHPGNVIRDRMDDFFLISAPGRTFQGGRKIIRVLEKVVEQIGQQTPYPVSSSLFHSPSVHCVEEEGTQPVHLHTHTLSLIHISEPTRLRRISY